MKISQSIKKGCGVLLALPILLFCVRAGGIERTPVETKPPRLFCMNPEALAKTKARCAAGDPALKPALDRLLSEADKALGVKPLSVMDKVSLPPSRDKHDYMSVAPYFWPDPTKKDGLPYIRKDGERNPESSGNDSNSGHFGKMGSVVETLSLAYYLSGNESHKESYAEHAAQLLRVWFLDSAIRMNPNLN